MSVTVRLSSFEIMHAATAGVARNVTAIRDARPLEDGRYDTGFGRHVDGAIGELAVAKHLGLYWQPAVGTLDTKTGDVAGIQVKSQVPKRWGNHLIVRPHDPEEFVYVLAILRLPDVEIVGKIGGWLAKIPEHWRERDPQKGVHRAAYFVPTTALGPLDELIV